MLVLFEILDFLLTLLIAAIFGRGIVRWMLVNHEHENPPLLRWINAITDPIVKPLQRVAPRVWFFDSAPLIAILIIICIQATLP